MNSILNRRAAMTALATGAAVALVPAAAAATVSTPASIRPEFREAERLMLQREAEASAHSAEVHEPLQQQWLAAVAALPHTSVTIGDVTWTTAEAAQVKVVQHIVARGGRGFRNMPEVREMRRLIAAHLRRERAAKRLPEAAAREAAYQENNRLSDISVAAEDAFFAMRPASLAELAHKLRVMAERQRDYEGCVGEIIMPDVLALSTRETQA